MAGVWSLLLMQNPAQVITGTGQVAELTAATSRAFKFSLTAGHTLTFTMPGRHRHTAAIVPLVSDVLAYRDSDAVMRFRVVGRKLSWSGGKLTATFSAVSYRTLLSARILHDADTRSWDSPTEQTAIAWAMIDASQSKTDGDLGITRGTLPGVSRDRTLGSSTDVGTGVRTEYFQAGAKIEASIDQIAAMLNGFWWDIEPDRSDPTTEKTGLKFNVWNLGDRNQFDPRSPMLLTPESTILDYDHSTTPSDFANVVRFTGAAPTSENIEGAAQTAAWAPAGTNPDDVVDAGRWERSLSDTGLVTQAAVDARAPQALTDAVQYQSEFGCDLARGRWDGRSELWLGDVVRVVVTELVEETSDEYILYLDEDMTVFEIGVTVDDVGAENVTVGLNRAPWSAARASKDIDDRISRLELR